VLAWLANLPRERAYTGPMPAPGPGDAAGDAVLVERLRSDEPDDAMRALCRLYGGELYGFTLNALGDRGAAEEIVEEVFLRAWRHAARYDPERTAVRAWLYQIARNAIIDARRRAAAGPGLPRHGPATEAESGETLEQAMLGWQVAAALERLTPEHRQMIRMVQFRGLTMREIAAHTGLPLGTVKSRTWYALRSLRLVLEEMEVTPP
jgi:RNA polymerase sigma-70 factor, ECF subfamily